MLLTLALALPVVDLYVDPHATNCASADGSAAAPFCTLDAALQAAVDGDRLLLAPGEYAPGSIVTEDLEIIGLGGALRTHIVGAVGAATTLTIETGATAVLDGVTVRDGNRATDGAAGLDVRGELTLLRSRIENHRGYWPMDFVFTNAVSGTLVARETVFAENSNGGRGGALFVTDAADVLIEDCAFVDNDSGLAGIISGAGGAIAIGPSSGSAVSNANVVVRRTTFEGNSCATPGYGGGGGAILVDAWTGSTPSLLVENCTFSANGASVGSAILVAGGGAVTIVASTFTGNASDLSGALHLFPPGVMTISHSIVAGNIDVWGSFSGRDLSGPVVSLGHNVVGDATGPAGQVFVPLASDVYDPDVALGPLGGHGAFGRLHALPLGSSAVDIGAAVAPLAVDARGVARPLGLADAGAFERGGFGTVEPCAAVANSTGAPSTVATQGSGIAGENDFRIAVEGLPAGQFALFLVSDGYQFQPMPGGSSGNLCLAGPITRILASTQPVSAAGQAVLELDLTAVPTNTGSAAVLAGDVRWFQLWHRDVGPVGPSNFSPALGVVFE